MAMTPGIAPMGASPGIAALAGAQAGGHLAQAGAIPGRGLDFYRSAPVREATPPRLTLRMPDRVVMR
jgi:hypothetical protein